MNDSVREYARRTAKPIKIRHKNLGSEPDNFLQFEVSQLHILIFIPEPVEINKNIFLNDLESFFIFNLNRQTCWFDF